jgi:hypothetical protein
MIAQRLDSGFNEFNPSSRCGPKRQAQIASKSPRIEKSTTVGLPVLVWIRLFGTADLKEQNSESLTFNYLRNHGSLPLAH